MHNCFHKLFFECIRFVKIRDYLFRAQIDNAIRLQNTATLNSIIYPHFCNRNLKSWNCFPQQQRANKHSTLFIHYYVYSQTLPMVFEKSKLFPQKFCYYVQEDIKTSLCFNKIYVSMAANIASVRDKNVLS